MPQTPAQTLLENLLAQLNLAQLQNNFPQIGTLLQQIADLIGVDSHTGSAVQMLPGGRQLHNAPLSPHSPHAPQVVERTAWDLIGKPCGRCGAVAMYYRIEFLWDYFDPAGHPPAESDQFAYLFQNALMKRGPLILSTPEDPSLYSEAVDKRYEKEYNRCYWKMKLPTSPRTGLNVAWFLYFDDQQVDIDNDETNEPDRWKLALVENRRLDAGSPEGPKVDSYQPLIEYELIPREDADHRISDRPTPFNCLGKNLFRMTYNALGFDEHAAQVQPFFP